MLYSLGEGCSRIWPAHWVPIVEVVLWCTIQPNSKHVEYILFSNFLEGGGEEYRRPVRRMQPLTSSTHSSFVKHGLSNIIPNSKKCCVRVMTFLRGLIIVLEPTD